MFKSTKKKQPKGRPSFNDKPMRRVNVMLDDGTINDAREIGKGNLSSGIRSSVAESKKRLRR